MPVLHMETDLVRGVGTQLQQVASSLQQQTQQLNYSAQALSNAWQGPSADIFVNEIQPLLQHLNQTSLEGDTLNQRLQREVDEWERIGTDLGRTQPLTSLVTGQPSNIGDVTTGLEIIQTYHSPDVSEYEFRLDADELVAFQPNYTGKELGNVMQELNAFIAKNHENGVCADNPELIQKMADILGIDYQEAQHQYRQLVKVMGDSKQDNIDSLSPAFDLKGYWGSRRQLLFGKVVGDSLGLHPAFAALLSPSGGLIGPSDGLVTLGLDGNLSGVVDENAWDYHGAAHDAAGYLYRNFQDSNGNKLGPGYEYINDGNFRVFNRDNLDTSSPLSGQVSGYLFWTQKLGVSHKDFLDSVIKASVLPATSIIL